MMYPFLSFVEYKNMKQIFDDEAARFVMRFVSYSGDQSLHPN